MNNNTIKITIRTEEKKNTRETMVSKEVGEKYDRGIEKGIIYGGAGAGAFFLTTGILTFFRRRKFITFSTFLGFGIGIGAAIGETEFDLQNKNLIHGKVAKLNE
eukprot:TRINITY_DN641_c0_g1_i4.p1 TRINITY_DN641_c0_g1~~TRINITY_DN641_c0_g1_i4.p1  ORF type:complete len:104 (-),score=30.72 TRINITY_DN641_c0_g1_i4:245-556(-)